VAGFCLGRLLSILEQLRVRSRTHKDEGVAFLPINQQEIATDVPNHTDTVPVVQISSVVVEHF
jgi:hypothetical protein